MASTNQALHDNLGYLTRQLERLNNQPRSAESDARIEKLSQQVEQIMVREMDQEEKVGYYEKLLQESRKPRQEQPAAERRAENTPDPETARVQTEYATIMGEIAEFCDDLGYPFALLWSKVDPLVRGNELRRGEPTANDPRGWRPFVKEVKALARREKELLVNQAKPKAAIDTTKSGGGGLGAAEEAYRRALRDGTELPPPDVIDSLTKRYGSRT